jgi:formylglycine-generating enzyme required for sulfatase activity
MKLKRIQPGAFQMGQADIKGALPHRVEITKPFYLGVTEVTQAQWQAVMGANPSHFSGGELPVEKIGWAEARDFCQRLTDHERNAGTLPPRSIYRLPTEAEWEYACRAGSSTAFCFGDSETGLDDYAWYRQNSVGTSHPVGKKKPNAWGLGDMHGNVWEWCDDWYAEYAGDAQADPKGPPTGKYRVVRGGSWEGPGEQCRSAHRYYNPPVNWLHMVGLRVVLDVPSRDRTPTP